MTCLAGSRHARHATRLGETINLHSTNADGDAVSFDEIHRDARRVTRSLPCRSRRSTALSFSRAHPSPHPSPPVRSAFLNPSSLCVRRLLEFNCSLAKKLVDRYRQEDGTWRLDDDFLREGTDLQSIINCTTEGDAIVFDTTRRINLTSRVIVPWTLTLSGGVERPERVDGVVRQSARQATFTCPEKNAGIFLIR